MGKIQVSTGKGDNTVNTTTVWDRIIELENNTGGLPNIAEKVETLETSLAQSAKKLDTKTIYLVSNGVDDTTETQAAFNGLNEGDCLYIKGKIILTDDITVSNKKNISIKGDGTRVSYFYNKSTGKTIKFTNVSFVNVMGVGFLGNGDPVSYGGGATSGDGIQLLNSYHFNFTDCEFSYHNGNGINLVDGCWVINFVNVRVIGNQLNGFYGTVKTALQATAINFTNPLIFANKQSGILWASTGLSITGGVIEYNDIGVNFDCSISNAGATGVAITGVDFEINKNGHIKGKSTASFTVSSLEISGCHFTDNGTALKPFIWFEGVSGIQSLRLGKNAYTGFSAVNILDLNSLALATCDIEILRGSETKFVNLGQSIVKGFTKKIAINGLIEQKGIPFSQLDKSDNLIGLPNQTGYWKIPNLIVRLGSLDLYVDTDATTDYSVQFTIFRLSENGTLTTSFGTTTTKTGGGNGKLSFTGIGLSIPFTANESIYVKTTINKPTTGTTLYVKNLTFNGEF